MSKPTSISVVGLHPIISSKELIEETRDFQWRTGLSESALKQANMNVREHFDNLYLVEIVVEPPSAKLDWSAIVQPAPGRSPSNWQVPYDEQEIEEGHWVFWLHFVDLKQPLRTEVGDITLPPPSPMPARLAEAKYEAP